MTAMSQKAAAEYQRVEDHLTEAMARCDQAIAALARLEAAGLEGGGRPDPARVAGLTRMLKARRQMDRAADELADYFFDASAALAPEAVDLDF